MFLHTFKHIVHTSLPTFCLISMTWSEIKSEKLHNHPFATSYLFQLPGLLTHARIAFEGGKLAAHARAFARGASPRSRRQSINAGRVGVGAP
jgi:hypothetical protein